MKYRLFLFFLLLFCIGFDALLLGQEDTHDPHFAFPELRAHSPYHHIDSLDEPTLANALRHGFFGVKARSFMMATLNEGDLRDYYAHGVGAGVHYRSKNWHGFHVGLGGFFMFNLLSNDLGSPDAQTQQISRYEVELFDIERPENRKDLDRLEELYIAYEGHDFTAMIGRFDITTPYLNPQDGRMRPTIEEGLLLNFHPSEKFEAQATWIWSISPRSTVEFFNMGESIGLYGYGRTTTGEPFPHDVHQSSSGVFMGDVVYRPFEGLSLRLFNQFVGNIFNTTYFNAEYMPEAHHDLVPLVGFQYHHQVKVGNGGHENQDFAYYGNQEQARTLSGRLGFANYKHRFTANYTRITSEGRFLLPREWGREPFYTFIPRERNEGFGDLNAYSVQYRTYLKEKKLMLGAAYGYYDAPDVKNFALNKYGLPSYHQFNLELRYKFENFLDGLEMQFLVSHKQNAGETYDNPEFVFNRVNMTNFSFVTNYHFTK
ncbi:MAG: OprD family outer membrane porin [Bernardetiaceae bacterium]|nr:OprD family outer membrane porin [Bernardetiaceae bacterium]